MPNLNDLKIGNTYTITYKQSTTRIMVDSKTKEKRKIETFSRNIIVGVYTGRGVFGSFKFQVGALRLRPRSFARRVIISVE